MQQRAGSPYSDAPDGPLVERGGAAQRLRNLGHAARNIRTCRDASCRTDGDWGLVDFNTSNVPAVPRPRRRRERPARRLGAWRQQRRRHDQRRPAPSATPITASARRRPGRPCTARWCTRGRWRSTTARAPRATTSSSSTAPATACCAPSGATRPAAAPATSSGRSSPPSTGASLNRVRVNSPRISYPDIATGLIPPADAEELFLRRCDRRLSGAQQQQRSSRTWIFPAMRRGGTSVYAFDVRAAGPARPAQPRLMWKFSAADHAGDGSRAGRRRWRSASRAGREPAWWCSAPATTRARTARIRTAPAPASSAGRGIFVMNAALGPAAAAEGSGSSIRYRRRAASPPTSRRSTSTGTATSTSLYAVDTRGNVWRINTSDPAARLHRLRRHRRVAGAEDRDRPPSGAQSQSRAAQVHVRAEPRRARHCRRQVQVGSGDREKPSAGSVSLRRSWNRFYGIRDDISGDVRRLRPPLGYGTSPRRLLPTPPTPASLDPLAMAQLPRLVHQPVDDRARRTSRW